MAYLLGTGPLGSYPFPHMTVSRIFSFSAVFATSWHGGLSPGPPILMHPGTLSSLDSAALLSQLCP